MYLEAEFRETESVVGAIRSLRVVGIEPNAIELFSAEPVELPRGVLDRPSRMSLVSVAGAIGFGSLATLFMYWAQHNYTLLTGGMPVFSFWAVGTIMFEMTMLGAIVSAFLWFVWESGLLRKREGPPAPLVEPGSIRLRVRYEQSQAPRVTDALRRSGGKW